MVSLITIDWWSPNSKQRIPYLWLPLIYLLLILMVAFCHIASCLSSHCWLPLIYWRTRICFICEAMLPSTSHSSTMKSPVTWCWWESQTTEKLGVVNLWSDSGHIHWVISNAKSKQIRSMQMFVSSDRSSCSDDGLLYIRAHFFRFSLSPLMQLM